VLHSNFFLRSGLKILHGEGAGELVMSKKGWIPTLSNILQHSQGGFPGNVWRIQVLQHNTNQVKTREKLSPKPADTAEVGALERYMKAATMLELQASQPLR
jgi:hypothetical protein